MPCLTVSEAISKEIYTIEVGRDSETGLPRWQVIRLDDKLHSPPDGRPAQIVFDDHGRPTEMGWFHENLYHRTTGPALVKVNPSNGICVYEEHRVFGKSHRSWSEPALICRDADTGETIAAHYFVDDQEVDPRFPPRLDHSP